MEITTKYIKAELEQMTKAELNELCKKYLGKSGRNFERAELIEILSGLDALRYAFEIIEYEYRETDPKKWRWSVQHWGKTYHFEKLSNGNFKLELNKQNSIIVENYKDVIGNYKHRIHFKNGAVSNGCTGDGWIPVKYLVK